MIPHRVVIEERDDEERKVEMLLICDVRHIGKVAKGGLWVAEVIDGWMDGFSLEVFARCALCVSIMALKTTRLLDY